jgi:hypothetical protein
LLLRTTNTVLKTSATYRQIISWSRSAPCDGPALDMKSRNHYSEGLMRNAAVRIFFLCGLFRYGTDCQRSAMDATWQCLTGLADSRRRRTQNGPGQDSRNCGRRLGHTRQGNA